VLIGWLAGGRCGGGMRWSFRVRIAGGGGGSIASGYRRGGRWGWQRPGGGGGSSAGGASLVRFGSRGGLTARLCMGEHG